MVIDITGFEPLVVAILAVIFVGLVYLVLKLLGAIHNKLMNGYWW